MTQEKAPQNVKRTPSVIQAELSSAEASESTIRRLLDKSLRKIRSARFEPYVTDGDGKRKRNPLLKDVREYEATLRCVSRHMAALRAEEAALIGNTGGPASEWDEFVPKVDA